MNNKIKLGFINVGVIGVTILGGYLYGQIQYVRGILDASKEYNKDLKRSSRVSYRNYYEKNKEEA